MPHLVLQILSRCQRSGDSPAHKLPVALTHAMHGHPRCPLADGKTSGHILVSEQPLGQPSIETIVTWFSIGPCIRALLQKRKEPVTEEMHSWISSLIAHLGKAISMADQAPVWGVKPFGNR